MLDLPLTELFARFGLTVLFAMLGPQVQSAE